VVELASDAIDTGASSYRINSGFLVGALVVV
jgi:hypothetical protein